ncbi:hypothetical protein GCM10025869_01910 [Homoserinibacter gongjuensis]|uniref:Uncharacterized protein n=1 Tax=Homoserinibacter gongjuensis TaxID=1162968 RepID=A0ABQ6JPJ5_9MICO|nr:hypothetical protein GCM10025869_01910 [Homoserinibacter gongjuensis]
MIARARDRDVGEPALLGPVMLDDVAAESLDLGDVLLARRHRIEVEARQVVAVAALGPGKRPKPSQPP